MAITEFNKLKIEGETKAQQVQYCKDMVKAAARYERLMALKDFTDTLEDLKRIKSLHEAEAKGWTEQLEGMSFFKKIRLLSVIEVNQTRANQLSEAIAYIPKLLAAANDARMFLRAVTEEEANATRN